MHCSCGEILEECSFWRGVAYEMQKRGLLPKKFQYYAQLQRKREAHWSHRGSFLPERQHDRYADIMKPFLDAVFSQVEGGNKVLIDSSKTAHSALYRPAAIPRLQVCKVRALHLVRDCRGVVWSLKKGLNKSMEAGKKERALLPTFRAITGWSYANRSAERLKSRLGEENYFLLRYEDFVENPVQVLKHVSDWWDIDLGQSILTARKVMGGVSIQIPVMHQLAGNRMRFDTELSIRPDYAWKRALDPKTNNLVKFMTGSLMKRYGYI